MRAPRCWPTNRLPPLAMESSWRAPHYVKAKQNKNWQMSSPVPERSINSQLPHGFQPWACVWAPSQLRVPAKALGFDFIARHIGAHKQQALLGPVCLLGMTAPRACLAGIVGVYLDSHALISQGFVGNQAMQFG